MSRPYPHRQIFVILGSCLWLLLWLEQTSVNAYWRQTFHRPSALEALDAWQPWRWGERLGQGVRWQSARLQQGLAGWDERMVRHVNACCLRQPPPPPAPKPAAPQARADHRLLLQAGQQVLLAGDSMMQGVAMHLQRPLFRQHRVKTIDASKQSTGLTYPDFFDWPATVERQLQANPQVGLLVVFLGANDTWDMVAPHGYIRFASPEWERRYRQRIRSILASARQRQVQVLWLGVPNMAKDRLNQGAHYLNRLYREELAQGGGRFVSSREVLGSRDDRFSKFITLPGQGEVAVRSADGVHFTRQGQLLLARRVLAELRFE